MYKVFFNDCFLAVSFRETDGINLDTVVSQYQDFRQIEDWLFKARNSEKKENVVLIHKNPEEVWIKIKELFVFIEAAGGLVRNKKNQYLFIYKKGKWDLPKGKIDKEETPSDAAAREVCEETGLKKIKIANSITNTYHVFKMKDNRLALKKTYWYLFDNEGTDDLVCQKEENIEKAVWFDESRLESTLNQSYGSIVDVFLEYKNLKGR